MNMETEIVDKGLWDHYSELPNPAWYDYKNKIMDRKEKALEIISEIEENITICCNASMDSDDVLDLIDKLKELIRDEKKEGGSNLENS
tara:strand:+ start:4680 stop:4943 length:264 start_codon:yes stop_codon:yes gene_type:complete